MKRLSKIFPVMAAMALGIMIVSCAPKAVVREEISATKEKPAQTQTVVVPDEKWAGEKAAVEDLGVSGAKKGGAKYVSLTAADEAVSKKAEETGSLLTVHFDFDKYIVKDDDKGVLDKDAAWLKVNASVKVRVEGHADERGEAEYNLALGEKRAVTVKNYLETMGIKNDRVSTISYGTEKPADPGHNEEAWSRNRRAEFTIQN